MDNDEIRISDLLYTVFKHRKTILVLGLLGFFKYWDFFAENLSLFLRIRVQRRLLSAEQPYQLRGQLFRCDHLPTLCRRRCIQ